MTFSEALAELRWDDHRFYHHCRINQSLHLLSALSFLCAYAVLPFEPAVATLIAWLIAMPSRQIGHFFFEPQEYDDANDASHEYKERVKVGYNLQRKRVLMSIWALSPLLLLVAPTMGGRLAEASDWLGVWHNVSVIWLVVGVGAIVFRTAQLVVLRDVQTGLAWATKIVTDPFHDILLYHRAPLLLARGERYDPIVTRGGHGRRTVAAGTDETDEAGGPQPFPAEPVS